MDSNPDSLFSLFIYVSFSWNLHTLSSNDADYTNNNKKSMVKRLVILISKGNKDLSDELYFKWTRSDPSQKKINILQAKINCIQCAIFG